TCNSRLSGFYKLSVDERRKKLAETLGLEQTAIAALEETLLDLETANHMVENVVGVYGLPFGIGLNFQVNGRDHLVPMSVEEPSVIAAASNAARMIRLGGGFTCEADEPIMISQIQLCEVRNTARARKQILAAEAAIVDSANRAYPSLEARGGGCRSID